MAKYAKIQVSFISLVDKPANKKDIVYKCRDKFNLEKVIKVTKVNDEGLVIGTVYEPNVKDTDGDWAPADVIKKAAHDFLLSGRNFNIDADHSEKPIGAAVVESSINAKGGWDVVIQMDPTSETFQKVKKGEYTGLSMMALVKKEDAEPPAGSDTSSPEITALKEQIAKQDKTIEDLVAIVKGIPKSRQLIIDNDGTVKISKGAADDDGEALSEFNFAALND